MTKSPRNLAANFMFLADKVLANSPFAYAKPMEIVDGINLDKLREGDSSECWKAADYIKR